jgi:hypothetical protein
MTKRVFLIRGFTTNSDTKQDHNVGKEVGNGVNRIRYQGLATSEYPREEL